MHATESAIEGLGFPESLRWREGALWFSDMFRSRVVRWRPGGEPEVVLDPDTGGPQMPGGLGWLPGGDLLVVDCLERRILRVDAAGVKPMVRVHADVSGLMRHPANDMHVDPDGVAWVGGYGFDPETDAPVPSPLVAVAPDGSLSPTNATLVFPNGCERAADGALVVAETFADRISRVDASGARSTLVRFPADSGPDGLSIGPDGRIHVALAFRGTVVTIEQGKARPLYTADAIPDGPAAGPQGCYDCAVTPDGGSIAIAMASADESLAMRVDTGSIRLVPLPEQAGPGAGPG
jgi:sugar lactone lactonase YvrE